MLGHLCVARQYTFWVFFFSSEDAFCNWFLENAAPDHPAAVTARLDPWAVSRYL